MQICLAGLTFKSSLCAPFQTLGLHRAGTTGWSRIGGGHASGGLISRTSTSTAAPVRRASGGAGKLDGVARAVVTDRRVPLCRCHRRRVGPLLRRQRASDEMDLAGVDCGETELTWLSSDAFLLYQLTHPECVDGWNRPASG